MPRLGRGVPRRLTAPPSPPPVTDTGPGARTAADYAPAIDTVTRVASRTVTATDSAPATDAVIPTLALNPAIPRPVLRTFEDGDVPTAEDLNGYGANTLNLYRLLQQGFRRDIRPMSIVRVTRENMELPTGVATAVTFDLPDIDTARAWNGQGVQYMSAARPGIYAVGFQWVAAPVATVPGATHQAWITVNSEGTGSPLAYAAAPQTGGAGVLVTAEVALNAGDRVRFYARHDQGTTVPVSPQWGGTRAWLLWVAPLVSGDTTTTPETPGGSTPTTFSTPGEALNIGPADGQNHFNLGVGFAPGDDPQGESAAIHRDFSQAVIHGGLSITNYWTLTPDLTGVIFRVPLNGGRTSSGTNYPRVELRELNPDGVTRAGWNGGSTTAYLEGEATINLNAGLTKPWVCFAQIHDAESDLMRLQTEGTGLGNLRLVMRATPPGGGSETATTIQASYTNNTVIKYRIEVTGGAGKVLLNGTVVGTFNANTTGLYFKAGAYAQTNSTIDNVAYGPIEVTHRNLVCWRTGYPPPSRPGAGGGTTPPPETTPPPTSSILPSTATLIGTLNWDTGNFSQFGTVQCQGYNASASGWSGGRPLAIVNDGEGHGSAARVEVRSGDSAAGGERAECRLGSAHNVVDGDERYYVWSTKFASGFPSPTGGWCIVMQWHAGDGSPPLAIEYGTSGQLSIGNNRSGSTWRTNIGPADPGTWHNYVLHVKFSNSASTGFIEMWRDGALVIPKTFRRNMASSDNYVKVGLYRGPMSGTQIVFHDGLLIYRP